MISLPFKRSTRDAPIEYPDGAEMNALLKSIDRTRPGGQHDYALFAPMFNTGARVQEVLNLRRRDVRLDAPGQVRLLGGATRSGCAPIGRLPRGSCVTWSAPAHPGGHRSQASGAVSGIVISPFCDPVERSDMWSWWPSTPEESRSTSSDYPIALPNISLAPSGAPAQITGDTEGDLLLVREAAAGYPNSGDGPRARR